MNVNTLSIIAILCASLATVSGAEKRQAGPKGGRLLEKTEPKAEFFVEKDHSVTITFYDASMKTVPPTEQSATVIAESKEGKQKIEFENKGDALVSKRKLPEGDGYPLVVQLKQRADAKPQNFRFKFEAHTCGGCKLAEYACICDE